MFQSKGLIPMPNKSYTKIKSNIVDTEFLFSEGKIGFFGQTPVKQQIIDYSTESIVNALKLYGLASEKTLWYLQEGPFNGSNGLNPPYYQGFSVDISYSGNTIVVGGSGYNLTGGLYPTPGLVGNIGGAWVFDRNSLGVWTQKQLLVANNYDDIPSQGWSVSISGDEKTIAVGAPTNGVPDIGATFIYIKVNNEWIQQQKLIGNNYTVSDDIYQGYSISLSHSGDTLIVGGPNNNTSTIFKGSFWIFQRTNGIWSQQAGPITPSFNSPYESFYIGQNLDISDDGNTVVISGILQEIDIYPIFWIYSRINGVWSKEAEFKIEKISDNYLPISISGNGNVIAIGRPLANGTEGTVDIYNKIGNVWEYNITLLGTGTFLSQGTSVSLSYDGNSIVFTGYTNIGSSMWIFEKDITNIWNQNGTKIDIPYTISARMSGDGKNIITGNLNNQEIRIFKN
jgi:hypothetical protein